MFRLPKSQLKKRNSLNMADMIVMWSRSCGYVKKNYTVRPHLYLNRHLVEQVTCVTNFVVGPLKLSLQLIHLLLTLLQLAL